MKNSREDNNCTIYNSISQKLKLIGLCLNKWRCIIIKEWYIESRVCNEGEDFRNNVQSDLHKFQKIKLFWNPSQQKVGSILCLKFHFIPLCASTIVNKAKEGNIFSFALSILKIVDWNHCQRPSHQKKSKEQRFWWCPPTSP